MAIRIIDNFFAKYEYSQTKKTKIKKLLSHSSSSSLTKNTNKYDVMNNELQNELKFISKLLRKIPNSLGENETDKNNEEKLKIKFNSK